MSKRKPKGANHPTIPPMLPQDVNSGWNAAVEYIAASFDKRAENHEFGACSYAAAAAIVRTYRQDPALPEKALSEIERRIVALEDRIERILDTTEDDDEQT